MNIYIVMIPVNDNLSVMVILMVVVSPVVNADMVIVTVDNNLSVVVILMVVMMVRLGNG